MMLSEMARVAKDNARAALLTATASLPLAAEWEEAGGGAVETSLGATRAYMHVLRRKPRAKPGTMDERMSGMST